MKRTMHRLVWYALLMVTPLTLAGCVANSDLLQKKAEAEALGRRIETMASDHEALQKRVKALSGERALLTAQRDRLAANQRVLHARCEAQRDEATRMLEEMKKKTIELEGDKEMLKESITLLKNTREEAMRTVNATYESLLEEMKEEIKQGQIAISELQGKLTIDVVDKILFDSGQAAVKAEGLLILKKVVGILKGVADKKIHVEGHTDNVPIAGALARRYPTNWELSAARAINVTRYLEKEGIDPARLSASAFGEHQPVADNETPEGRAQNRRIAIILLPNE